MSIVTEVGMFQRNRIFVAWMAKCRKFDPGNSVVSTPLCVTGPEFLCGPTSKTQKNVNSPVLMAKVHAGTKYIALNLWLIAQSSSVERWGALVLSFRCCGMCMGTQLGMRQPRARLAGKFSHVQKALSQIPPLPEVKG